MLKLVRYSFSGIGRFVEKQTVDVKSKSHLIQIDGMNTTTGGSSGSGKSTTVEALAYLLGISEIPATQLQSRISEEPIYVEAEFEGGIRVIRSKKDGLIIETPEETVSGNSKLAEEKLDQIIGVSRDLLKTMCYKRQKQGGFLLNLTPKQSYDFLMQCLDLKDFQHKIQKLEENIKNKYKPKKIELDSSIKVLQETVCQLKILIDEKKEPSPPEYVDELEIKNSIVLMENKLKNIEENNKESLKKIGDKPVKPEVSTFEKEEEIASVGNQINEIRNIIQSNVSNKTKEIEQASFAISKIKDKINEINQIKTQSLDLYAQTKDLLVQKEYLEKNTCPTCLRDWEEQANKNKLNEINEKIKTNQDTIGSFLKEVEKIPHYKILQEKAEKILEQKKNMVINILEEKDLAECQERQRILLNEKQNLQSSVNERYLEELNQWNDSVKSIMDKFGVEKSKITSTLDSLKHKLDKIHIEKNNYEQSKNIYEEDCKNIQNKIELNSQELKTKIQELNEIEKNIILSEESVRLIKGFTLQKFQDTLNYIGNRATQIINMIPNMSNAVIFFENSKETKTGGVKNEINAVINLEGDVAIPIKTLSGGERTSADFAIDLAVSEMIENMTQKGVNFMIIDEGFDGLDSISKIQCLEVLKNINTEKKIFIIDHSSEVKEMLCDTILIKRVGEKSFIYE